MALTGIQLYILWPEDGPVEGPKHVVSLNKINNIRYLCFDTEELLLICKYTAKVIENKRRHIVEQNVQNQTTNTQIYPH